MLEGYQSPNKFSCMVVVTDKVMLDFSHYTLKVELSKF
jgi:hypothetical protein